MKFQYNNIKYMTQLLNFTKKNTHKRLLSASARTIIIIIGIVFLFTTHALSLQKKNMKENFSTHLKISQNAEFNCTYTAY